MTQPDGRLAIAVVGGGTANERQSALAREVGRRIAKADALLVCGGGGGVMREACAGARAEDGATLGILPGRPGEAPMHPDLQTIVHTGLGQARNLVVVLTADAVVAVGGEWGTLSEIALARKHSVPVVLLESWGLESPDEGGDADLESAATPEEAVSLAVDLARRRKA